MTQIRINLSNDENKIAVICKVMKNFKTKEDAIKYIIRKYKEGDMK